MRYIADHDFHIHSTVSNCCHDENQTPQIILEYAKKNGFKKICLTNHFWDERVESVAIWHHTQTFASVSSVLPLPQDEDTSFLFGVEADMDYNFEVGISKERYDDFDFLIIPTTHMHILGYTIKSRPQNPVECAEIWFNRLEALLEKDLPWHKTGIAHLTCRHIFEKRTPEVLAVLSEDRMYSDFEKCAEKGVGIELNLKTLSMTDELKNIVLKPYFIAKDCGCKFYLGSDSHDNASLIEAKENFEDIITLLDLKESDKFVL